jgi:small subunit ribosomal protein S17
MNERGLTTARESGEGREMVEATAAASRGQRQTKVGTVISDRMDKTVVVAVEKTVMHRLYRRYVKRTSRFYAHDEQNDCHIGDRVEIVSTRPLSRLKRWRVEKVLARGEEG